MVQESIPFVFAPLAVAVGFGLFQLWLPFAIFLFVTGFMAYFFRDPKRIIPQGPGLIVSAADGRVTRIDELDDAIVVSVFLSPLDVHINRSPIAGRIANIDYVKGRKIPATSDNASFVNERNSLLIEGEDLTVTCTQIAGILARRIVCWPKTGDILERGQKIGLIKFGSRTDLRLPLATEIIVKVGDRVLGGETIIGKIESEKVKE